MLSLIVAALLVNIPLGVWRSFTRKFSWQWFAAIHLSIPFLIWLRFRLGYGYEVIPLSIGAAVIGQIMGGWLKKACIVKCIKPESH